VFKQHFPCILYRFDGISGFPLAETGETFISAARGRVGPEMTSPFDSLTSGLASEILRPSLTVQKLFDFFDYY
jgi:hypothetical protein